MTDGQVALYARVSSEHQAEANTIDSQVAEIRARIAADGIDLRSVLEFIDAGYSGSSLVRPALEGLRDCGHGGRARSPLRALSRSLGAPLCLSSLAA
jgi:site-specific DNA recombinase